MTMNRTFTHKQRAALSELHDFACAACGAEAVDGHADHVVPFADGGATAMGNAQWLCPACNLSKARRTIDYRKFMVAKPTLDLLSLRRWQTECLEQQLDHLTKGGISFSVASSVSAGKTMQALSFYMTGGFDAFIVITPKSGIRSSWTLDAKKLGLRVERVLSGSSFNPLGTLAIPNGFILNAQMLASVSEKLAFICQNLRVLLIVDEAHHYGEGNKQTLDLTGSLGDASFLLALSGTPFRTDKKRIIGFGYSIEGNEACLVPEYIYDNETALRDGVVALVTHAFVGGSVTLERDGSVPETYSYRDNYADEDGISPAEVHRRTQLRLRLSTMNCREWQCDAVLLAKKELDSHGSFWAGLVICRTIEQADAVVSYLEGCGEKVMRIYSDVQTEAAVAEFNDDFSYKWAVTITKIGEGVSVPRLRVGVWLSPVTARTCYEQFRGRFSRLMPGVPQSDQTATFYIPADPRLVEYAENSRKTILHRFTIGDEVNGEGGEGSVREATERFKWITDALYEPPSIMDLGDYSVRGAAEVDGVEVDGSSYSPEEIRAIREELVRLTGSEMMVNRLSHSTAILWRQRIDFEGAAE